MDERTKRTKNATANSHTHIYALNKYLQSESNWIRKCHSTSANRMEMRRREKKTKNVECKVGGELRNFLILYECVLNYHLYMTSNHWPRRWEEISFHRISIRNRLHTACKACETYLMPIKEHNWYLSWIDNSKCRRNIFVRMSYYCLNTTYNKKWME